MYIYTRLNNGTYTLQSIYSKSIQNWQHHEQGSYHKNLAHFASCFLDYRQYLIFHGAFFGYERMHIAHMDHYSLQMTKLDPTQKSNLDHGLVREKNT